MVTVLRAVRNMAGVSWDVWDANVEEDYHETERSGGLGGVGCRSLDSICNRLADR